jgi:hypothetical protein
MIPTPMITSDTRITSRSIVSHVGMRFFTLLGHGGFPPRPTFCAGRVQAVVSTFTWAVYRWSGSPPRDLMTVADKWRRAFRVPRALVDLNPPRRLLPPPPHPIWMTSDAAPPPSMTCGSVTYSRRCDFRCGSKASGWPDHGDFRSTPVSGHSQDRRACLKGASFGLMHRTKTGQCSITASARVRVGSFGQARFPKPLDQQLRV